MSRPVALITMATGYVGPSLARRLAPTHDLVLHGAVGSAAEVPLADLVPALELAGAAVLPIVDVDLTTAAGNRDVVETAIEHFGRLDAACLVTGRIVLGKFLDMTEDQWATVKATNLDMVFHGLQAVLRPMRDAGRGGRVVVFTSATGARPEPMVSIYGGTRAGANALVRAVGLEHARDGITVNAIGTNYMDFPGFLTATGADDPARRAAIEAQVPMRRLGTMDELAEFTALLLDGRTGFQTGQFFSFSGGWST